MRFVHTVGAIALSLAFLAQPGDVFAAPTRANNAVLLPHPPAQRQHTEFTVEVNGKGQVTRAVKVVRSDDSSFNAITYGNALQVFIRTPDGRAIAGTYRLSYDYNPSNKMVHRSVALVQMGKVNANATGAVLVEAAKIQAQKKHYQAADSEASALPGLHQMTRHHH